MTDMQYGYGILGIILHPFAGALGPAFILTVDSDKLRRAEGVKSRYVNECRNWYSNIRIGYSNIRMIYTSMPNRPITITYLVVHVLKI